METTVLDLIFEKSRKCLEDMEAAIALNNARIQKLTSDMIAPPKFEK